MVVVAAIAAVVVLFVLPDGSHRVAGGVPAAPHDGAGPRWDTPGHHWVGMSEAWSAAQVDSSPQAYGLASDGQRVVALRKGLGGLGKVRKGDQEPDAELTAYEGGTGRQLWRKTLPWIKSASPVGGNGIFVVPSGKNSDDATSAPRPAEYVALDSATGSERWRVRVAQRAEYPLSLSSRGAAPGVFLDGVFYYGDGPKIVGVDAATGKVRYQVTSKKNVIVAGPVVAAGRVTVLTKPATNYDDPSYVRTEFMFTPDLKSQVSSNFPDHAKPSALATSGDVVVAWGEDVVWATDARTGRGLWSKQLPRLTDTAGVLGRAILVHDARNNNQQKILAYDLLDGKELWSAEPPDESGYASDSVNVGIADGTLFAMAHGISIVDLAKGEINFTRSTNRGGGLVAAADGHIIIYNQDGITGYL